MTSLCAAADAEAVTSLALSCVKGIVDITTTSPIANHIHSHPNVILHHLMLAAGHGWRRGAKLVQSKEGRTKEYHQAEVKDHLQRQTREGKIIA